MSQSNRIAAALFALTIAIPHVCGQEPPRRGPEFRTSIVGTDGTPLVGAGLLVGDRAELSGDRARQQPTVRTGTDGSLIVRLVESRGQQFGLLVADGHASRLLSVGGIPVGPGGAVMMRTDFDLGVVRLAAGGELRGLVRDAKGEPIEGAQVEVLEVLGATHIRHRPRNAADLGNRAFGRSAAKGVFRVANAPRGAVAISVRKSGYLVTHLPYVDPREPLVVILRAGGKVRGRIMQKGGAPAAAQRFAIYYEASEVLESHVTDAAGRFAVDLDHAGRYRIGVTPPQRGMTPHFSKVLDRPTDGVELVITPTPGIGLRVVDADGKPVPRFRAVALWQARHSVIPIEVMLMGSFGTASVAQSSPGRATVPAPRPGASRKGFVQVKSPGFAPAILEVDLDAERKGSDVTVQLVRGGRITGICRDAKTGAPRAGLTVEVAKVSAAKTPRYQLPTTIRTDGAGRFALDILAAGEYRVGLAKRLWPKAQAKTIVVTAGANSTDIELAVPSGVDVAGRLVGTTLSKQWQVDVMPARAAAGGNPFARITQMLHRNSDSGTAQPLDAEGRFRLRGVQPGSYNLVLVAPQPGGGVMKVDIARLAVADEAIEREFDVAQAQPGKLRGKVACKGVHVPPGRLLLALETGPRRATVFSTAIGSRLSGPKVVAAADGSFEVDAVPGQYRLLAVDLATGVLLHESDDDVRIVAGKSVARVFDIALGFARITLTPAEKNASMARVARVQVRVDQPGVAVDPRFAGLPIDAGHGIRIASGQRVVELFLPLYETKVLARNAAHHLVGSGQRRGGHSLGEVEFTPGLGKSSKIILKIEPPADH